MKEIVPTPPPIVRNQFETIRELFTKNVVPSYGRFDIALSHGEGSYLFDVNGRRYLDLGVEEVVVKDGANPALIATASERVKVAPPAGATVVDATGAGDSFNGAYLSARLAGKSLREAAEAAHRVAGIVIGQRGALVEPGLVR